MAIARCNSDWHRQIQGTAPLAGTENPAAEGHGETSEMGRFIEFYMVYGCVW